MSRLALWSIRTMLALEPFLAVDVAPGAEYSVGIRVSVLPDPLGS